MNFLKKCLFLPEKCIFLKKNANLTHWTARDSADVKELFFWKVILHQFSKRKNKALYSKIVQAIFHLDNLAQKVPFLEENVIILSKNYNLAFFKNLLHKASSSGHSSSCWVQEAQLHIPHTSNHPRPAQLSFSSCCHPSTAVNG